jgi:hypothetical protein
MEKGTMTAADDKLIRKLQSQIRILSALVALSFLFSLMVAARLLTASKATTSEDHVTTRHISLTDPKGRVVGEIGSEQGLGNDKDLYRPFLKFWDRGNDPVLAMYGTGLNLVQGNNGATYDFLGFHISSKEAHLFGNDQMIAYSSKGGNLMILPTDDGMSFTIASVAENGRENSTFGALVHRDGSSMYVAANGNEADVNATREGTSIVRGRSR